MELFLLKDGNPEAVEPAHGVYIEYESHGSRLFGRLILPDRFIPQYEVQGLMLHVDLFVLETAITTVRRARVIATGFISFLLKLS